MTDEVKFGPDGLSLDGPLTPPLPGFPPVQPAAASPFDAVDETPTVIDDTPTVVEAVKGEKFSSTQLVELLRQRYPTNKGEYALYEQVGNSTGHRCNTWVDAVVLGLWPSTGLQRMAFEVKISRSDFLREMNTPGKNQFARQNCHEFYFVAPAGVIKEHELPPGDGWLAPRGDKLVMVKRAQRREVANTNAFMAALGRAAFKTLEGDRARMNNDQVLADPRYKQAKAWEDAARTFLNERGQRAYAVNVDGVLAALRAATAGEGEHVREQVKRVMEAFKSKAAALADFAVLLGSASVIAADEAGDFVVKAYGDGRAGVRLGRHQRSHHKEVNAVENALRRILEEPPRDPTAI